MIKLEDIKGYSVLPLLEKYMGINPYILKLKNEYIRNKKITLTDTQSKYIKDNHDTEPLYLNKILKITPYLGEELKEKHGLKFTPEKLLVEFMLAETEKAYHVYGKLTRGQKQSVMYWLPKTQVLDDPYFEEINIDVDFEKYNKILSKSNKKLFQHQEEAIKFLLTRNGSILAFGMGMGKSMCAIVAALESGAKKILVVCPSSLKINWEREIHTFCSDTAIVNGKKWDSAKFTIINFDILKNFHNLDDKNRVAVNETYGREIISEGFDLCIIDEAHYLKSHDTIRSKLMVDICVNHGIEKVWLLTGTPVANRPIDLYNLLKLIKSPLVTNWRHYVLRYCDGKTFYKVLKNGRKKQIWLTDGASNLEELAQKIRPIFLRKTKEEVLDLPEKIVTPIHHELTPKQKKEYDKLWDDYVDVRKSLGRRTNENQRDMVELILLRTFIAMEMIPNTIELANNALEEDRKVIIFTNFTEELMTLYNYFGDIAVIHNGKMSNEEKQVSVDRFQNDKNVKVFIGNIKSAGVGITLTEGEVTIFNSFDWVTGNNEQCEDRNHRLGVKHSVNIYYQLFDNTISTRMWWTLKKKQEVINTIISGGDFDENEITEKLIEITLNENE